MERPPKPLDGKSIDLFTAESEVNEYIAKSEGRIKDMVDLYASWIEHLSFEMEPGFLKSCIKKVLKSRGFLVE